jgi:hypothetical protein
MTPRDQRILRNTFGALALNREMHFAPLGASQPWDRVGFASRGQVPVAGLAAIEAMRLVYSTSGPPDINDDNTTGRYTGTWWYDDLTGLLYYCASDATGAADWVPVGGGGTVAATLAGSAEVTLASSATWADIVGLSATTDIAGDVLVSLSLPSCYGGTTAWLGVEVDGDVYSFGYRDGGASYAPFNGVAKISGLAGSQTFQAVYRSGANLYFGGAPSYGELGPDAVLAITAL